MDIDLNRLRHIVAIARARSFSRAAEDLNLTQPALSRSITSFEQRFGLRLFDRDRAGVAPTAMGRLVIAEAERLLRAAHDLEHNLRLYARGEGGDLAIGLGPLLAMLLPVIGQRLLERAPGLNLRASIRTPDHLVQELLDDRIELVFGNSWSIREIPDLEITPIGTVPLAFLARAGHPLAGRPGVHMADLTRFPQASAAGSSVPGLQPEVGSIICDNYHVLREMVYATDCVWLASPMVLETDMAAGGLVAIDIADFGPVSSEVAMVRRRGRTLSEAARQVTAEITALIIVPAAPLSRPAVPA